MAVGSMRDFLDLLQERGELQRVDLALKGLRGDSELHVLMRHLHLRDGPALILSNVAGINTDASRILFNLFGSRRRAAMMFGRETWEEARAHHASVLGTPSLWHEPIAVSSSASPCKEVIVRDVDLRRDLPHVWFGKEGAPYITGAIVTTRDPVTGDRNVGWYRLASFVGAAHPKLGNYSADRVKTDLAGFFWWNPAMSHIGRHIASAVRAGRRLQIACAVMCQPAVHIAAATSLPYGADEFAFAGGLSGAPVELVQCETVDLQVPATAEWVIEGEMRLGVEEEVGWHSNPMGYYDEVHTLPVMQVTCITHRRDPFWYATMEMVPPFDHMYLGLLPIEGELLQDIRARIPDVKDVVVTPNLAYIVQLGVDGANKPFPGFGRYVVHAVWGSGGRWARSAKMVIVVGPDVNPRSWEQIEWAIMTRVQPCSDILLNPSGPAMVLDPSVPRSAQGAGSLSEQFGIDATIKVPERHLSYPPVSNVEEHELAMLRAKLRGIV